MKKAIESHWTLGFGILCIIGSLSLLLVHPPEHWIEKLSLGVPMEIGFAFVIAWVVAHLVEARARAEYDRYTQEKSRIISQNVFGYLYSVKFPREAFAVIEEFLISRPIIKSYQKLDYEILSGEVAPGWVRMRCEFDYELVNLSESSVDHPIRFYYSKASGQKQPEIEGLGLQSIVIGDTPMPKEQFEDYDKAAPDEVGQQKFEIPQSIGPNETKRVRVTFVQLKRVDDNDLYQSSCVSRNLELKFRFDPTLYDVFIEPVHPCDMFDSDLGPNGGDMCRTVRIDRPLLPKNGVFIWWNRRESDIEPMT